MKTLPHHLATLAVTAWVGALWSIGYLAVPVLFNAQADRQLAGMLAGEMFLAVGYLGMTCGTYLLTYHLAISGRAALRSATFRIIAAMLLTTLALQYAIQPLMAELKAQALPLEVMHSAFAQQFRMLHGISSLTYLAQSLLAALLVVKLNGARTPRTGE
ncbi:MAG: DUF4149 domain-containing protein [Gallionella sp.]|nr:DUF4149 domain-containing protein [Gallionella sp.]